MFKPAPRTCDPGEHHCQPFVAAHGVDGDPGAVRHAGPLLLFRVAQPSAETISRPL